MRSAHLVLGAAIAFNDFVISPIPPDFLFLILSKSDATAQMFGPVGFLGLCSGIGWDDSLVHRTPIRPTRMVW